MVSLSTFSLTILLGEDAPHDVVSNRHAEPLSCVCSIAYPILFRPLFHVDIAQGRSILKENKEAGIEASMLDVLWNHCIMERAAGCVGFYGPTG